MLDLVKGSSKSVGKLPSISKHDTFDRYDIGPKLGEGANGKVVLITMRSTGQKYAMKIFYNKDKWPTAKQEASILKDLHHENIINFIRLMKENGEVPTAHSGENHHGVLRRPEPSRALEKGWKTV